MTVEQALTSATKQFTKATIPSARLDAELLLSHSIGQNREYLLSHYDQVLTDNELAAFHDYVSQRLDRQPVCYITGVIEFYGLELFVDNRVLSPRIETELVVEQAILHAPPNTTLIDIGTGSGAIAVAIAKHRPDLTITATEISDDALEIAKQNAITILGKNHAITFLQADIFDGVSGKYQTVVTNLPYVSDDYRDRMKPEVAKEPSIALFGGKGDGLDLYRRFYEQLPAYITKGSRVYHESDPWQHSELKTIAKSAGLHPILEEYLILGFEKV